MDSHNPTDEDRRNLISIYADAAMVTAALAFAAFLRKIDFEWWVVGFSIMMVLSCIYVSYFGVKTLQRLLRMNGHANGSTLTKGERGQPPSATRDALRCADLMLLTRGAMILGGFILSSLLGINQYSQVYAMGILLMYISMLIFSTGKAYRIICRRIAAHGEATPAKRPPRWPYWLFCLMAAIYHIAILIIIGRSVVLEGGPSTDQTGLWALARLEQHGQGIRLFWGFARGTRVQVI